MVELRVWLTRDLVADGLPVPRVGDEVSYPLGFSDHPDHPEHSHHSDLATGTVDAHVTLLDGGRARQGFDFDGSPSGPPLYSALVSGPGWSAIWRTAARVEGDTRLRGSFHVTTEAFPGTDPRVSGRVVHVSPAAGQPVFPTPIVPGGVWVPLSEPDSHTLLTIDVNTA